MLERSRMVECGLTKLNMSHLANKQCIYTTRTDTSCWFFSDSDTMKIYYTLRENIMAPERIVAPGPAASQTMVPHAPCPTPPPQSLARGSPAPPPPLLSQSSPQRCRLQISGSGACAVFHPGSVAAASAFLSDQAATFSDALQPAHASSAIPPPRHPFPPESVPGSQWSGVGIGLWVSSSRHAADCWRAKAQPPQRTAHATVRAAAAVARGQRRSPHPRAVALAPQRPHPRPKPRRDPQAATYPA